jgi:hypothetical protein
MRLLAIRGKGGNTLVRFPTDRMRVGHFFELLPAPGVGGRGHRLERWVPALLGKVIPMKETASLSQGSPDRTDDNGDAA